MWAERGVAGARVVDREAERDPDLVDPAAEGRVVLDRLVLGDLEHDRARPGLPEEVGEAGRVVEQGRRDVDVEPGVARQACGGGQGRLQRRELQLDAEADRGRGGEMRVGRDAVGEPGQRLEPDGHAGREGHDRLEDRTEGVEVDHPPGRRSPLLGRGPRVELRTDQDRRDGPERGESRQRRRQAVLAVRAGGAELQEPDRPAGGDDRGHRQGGDPEPGERRCHRRGRLRDPSFDRRSHPGELEQPPGARRIAAGPGQGATHRGHRDAVDRDGREALQAVVGQEQAESGIGDPGQGQDAIADRLGGTAGELPGTRSAIIADMAAWAIAGWSSDRDEPDADGSGPAGWAQPGRARPVALGEARVRSAPDRQPSRSATAAAATRRRRYPDVLGSCVPSRPLAGDRRTSASIHRHDRAIGSSPLSVECPVSLRQVPQDLWRARLDVRARKPARAPGRCRQISSAISSAARAAPWRSTGRDGTGRSISSAIAAPITSGSASSNSMNRPAP